MCLIAEENDAARIRHRRSLCGGKPYDNSSLCCVDKIYSEDDQLCCDGNILPKLSGSSVRNSCCGPVAYNDQDFACCAKTLNDISGGMFCCGTKNYNSLNQKCEQGMIIERNTNIGFLG